MWGIIILLKVPFPSVQMVEMEEGNEPDEFWECLGGKGDYASGVELEALVRTDYLHYLMMLRFLFPHCQLLIIPQVNERPPRLFQMSNASGYFKVEEIYNFNQDVGHAVKQQ